MKRHGNLFEAAFTRDALFDAYIEARRGKRLRKACYWFDIRAGAVLDWLHWHLHNGSYAPRGYHRFMVYEPKPREICAPWFGDIVVQHAIYHVIRPIFEKAFIEALELPYRVIDTAAGELNLLSTTTVFGAPRDVTVADLAVESFYPADEGTRAVLAQM